ncbi:MAG TPA: hypothetical protein VGE77_08605, partial [Nocardioides sp.]
AWVKNSLSALPAPRSGLSESLRGRLCDGDLIASYAQAATWVVAPTPADQRRHRWTLAAVGGGAVGAAMLGVVALGAAPAQAPTGQRPSVTSLSSIVEIARTHGVPQRSGAQPTGVREDGTRR